MVTSASRRPWKLTALPRRLCYCLGAPQPASRTRPVTLGLRWTGAPGRYSHFDRLDWRPVSAHNNRGIGPVDLRFQLIDGSHHHRLALNAAAEMGLSRAMAENLPIAEPVLPEPVNWEAFLAIAGDRWRIPDLVNTPYPPWQYGLLPLTGGEARGGKAPRVNEMDQTEIKGDLAEIAEQVALGLSKVSMLSAGRLSEPRSCFPPVPLWSWLFMTRVAEGFVCPTWAKGLKRRTCSASRRRSEVRRRKSQLAAASASMGMLFC